MTMAEIGCWNCGSTVTVWTECDDHTETQCLMLKCLNCNCVDKDCELVMEVAQ